jgi:hypothetical protein
MLYRDADHVDTGGFYARRPELGKVYRLLGYGGMLLAWFHQGDATMLARLLVVLVLMWLMAWYRVVGALWRTSVVAAILLCAVLLSVHAWKDRSVPSATATATAVAL